MDDIDKWLLEMKIKTKKQIKREFELYIQYQLNREKINNKLKDP